MGDIYTTLHCPAPFQLLYSWGRPAGSAAPVAAAAAPLPVPPGKQTSSRAAQRSAEAAQLTAELREAISAVAAATGPAGAAAPVSGHSQQKQEQQRAAAPGLFLQLLQGSEAENHAMPAAEAAVELSFGGFLDGAEAPQFCTQQQSAAPPSLAVGGGGTPVQAAQPCSSEAHMVADEAAATPGTGDPRKPRGLLSLLQTSAGKAGKRTPAIRKQGAQSQRKASCTSSIGANQRSRGRRQKQQQQQQQPTSLLQQQQGAGEAPYGMPLPAGFAPYPWTHMHPHLQAVPILQQPQLIQPVLQVPVLQPQHPGHEPAHLPSQPAKQPQAAAGSHRLPPELDFGGDSLFQLLDPGHASPATGWWPEWACGGELNVCGGTKICLNSAPISVALQACPTCRCLAAQRKGSASNPAAVSTTDAHLFRSTNLYGTVCVHTHYLTHQLRCVNDLHCFTLCSSPNIGVWRLQPEELADPVTTIQLPISRWLRSGAVTHAQTWHGWGASATRRHFNGWHQGRDSCSSIRASWCNGLSPGSH